MDTIIIDGYNLLCSASPYADLARKDFEEARKQFIRKLERYQHISGNSITVVFDGTLTPSRAQNDTLSYAGESRRNGVRVIYTRGQDADSMIESLVSQQRGSKGGQRDRTSTVVTEDRELIRRIRRLGARQRGHREFTDQLAQAREAWGGQDTYRSGQSVFENLDAESLNALKKLRMQLESANSKSKR